MSKRHAGAAAGSDAGAGCCLQCCWHSSACIICSSCRVLLEVMLEGAAVRVARALWCEHAGAAAGCPCKAA